MNLWNSTLHFSHEKVRTFIVFLLRLVDKVGQRCFARSDDMNRIQVPPVTPYNSNLLLGSYSHLQCTYI